MKKLRVPTLAVVSGSTAAAATFAVVVEAVLSHW